MPPVDRDKVAQQYVEVLLDDAYQIREDQTELNERKRANREDLRNAARSGRLTDEQLTHLAELYPERGRTETVPEA